MSAGREGGATKHAQQDKTRFWTRQGLAWGLQVITQGWPVALHPQTELALPHRLFVTRLKNKQQCMLLVSTSSPPREAAASWGDPSSPRASADVLGHTQSWEIYPL